MHVVVGGSNLRGNAARKVFRKGAILFFDLYDHLFIDLDGVNLKIEILVLDETVYTLGKNALQIALTRAPPCIRRHHPRDGCVGAEEGTELCRGLELRRENGLKHREEEVLFSAFVLVSV